MIFLARLASLRDLTARPLRRSVWRSGVFQTPLWRSRLFRTPLSQSPVPSALHFGPVGALLLLLAGCGTSADGASEWLREYVTLEWIDLLPDADFKALLNPPAWMDEIEEGSDADQLDLVDLAERAQLKGDAEAQRYFEALASTDVIARYNQQAVRLPGFVVPLETDDQQRVTEFFLVPWFGACLHLPPPPPNQMLHVRYPQGLALARLEDPYWVQGILATAIVDHSIGTAAYTVEADHVRPYVLDGG